MVCPRCLELEDELERVKAIAARAGVYGAASDGPNPTYDIDRESSRWLAAHPRATPAEAWRGGWLRAWSIARGLLKDSRGRWEGQAREIGLLRSRLGVALRDVSRLSDRG